VAQQLRKSGSINEIAGGTGKYVGIRGTGPWKCTPVGGNGEIQWAQRLD